MSGPRSAPAELPGFTLLRGIGGGGFADVFLYREDRLDREVAVKILRAEHLSATSLRQFETEANVMARTSAHPYIVTIYASGVATDGRPYIAMEFYPRDHFGLRARGGKLGVAEVLRVGVQVASAVETAHRAGIVHRDIKPANILTSEYGRPGLTDFGISGVRLDNRVEAATGVTVAFASPEALRDDVTAGNEASDLYSLAATLYTLLAGRSPFWIPGGDNTDHAVFDRALNGNPPGLDRPDIPPALNHLLRQGMAIDPADRPPTALAFARQLQDIEQNLALAPTPIELRDADPLDSSAESSSAGPSEDDDGTRRAPRVVDPDGHDAPTSARPGAQPAKAHSTIIDGPPPSTTIVSAAPSPSPSPSSPSPWAAPLPKPVSADEIASESTVARRPAPPPPAPTPAGGRRPVLLLVVAGALLVLAGVGLLLARPKDAAPPVAAPDTSAAPVTSELVLDRPPTPTKVTATIGADGQMTVTMAPDGPPGGLTATTRATGEILYRLIRTDRAASWPDGRKLLDQPGSTDASGTTTVIVTGLKPTEKPCFTVLARTENRMSDPSAEVCAVAATP